MTPPRRGGLGRGLGALLPTAPPDGDAGARRHLPGEGRPRGGGEPGAVPGAELREVTLTSVTPNPRQPRANFDADAHAELVASIQAVGILQPIVVREVSEGRYELVMGERRWRAAAGAGLPSIPAIVRQTADDAMLRDALLENLHRQDLNPLEEAAAYQQLLAEFGVTHEELASRLGRSRSQISNTLRLLHLPPAVQRRVAAGVISAGHARALLALDDPVRQEGLASRIVAEGLSVRSVEEIVAVGDRAEARSKAPRTAARENHPAVAEAVSRLGELLDTRVRVEIGRSKGRITVEFADVEDLARIVATIAGL
jgi:ParB family chromosome partitioning protein